MLLQLGLAFGNKLLASVSLFIYSLQIALIVAHALANSRHLGFELPQIVTRGHRLLLGFATLGLEIVEQGSQFDDFLGDKSDLSFLIAQFTLKVIELLLHVAKFALHRQRSFTALLSARHGDVVEAF